MPTDEEILAVSGKYQRSIGESVWKKFNGISSTNCQIDSITQWQGRVSEFFKIAVRTDYKVAIDEVRRIEQQYERSITKLQVENKNSVVIGLVAEVKDKL